MLTPEDILIRSSGIGASESPCLVGASPFGGPISVWAKKMGMQIQDPTEAMECGNFLEDGIMMMYAAKTKREIACFGSQRHPKYPWMVCTPDRAVFGERRIAQAKLVGTWMVDHWEEGVPDYVEIQVQHEMEVCDVPVCDVVAVLGGTEYRCIPIERDREMGQMLVDVCHDFWTRHVLTGEMPDPDGSEEARETLNRRWQPTPNKTVLATPELEALGVQWLIEKEREKAAKSARERVEQKIKLIMGDVECIEGESFRCTWKKTKAETRQFLLKEAGTRKVAA